MTTSIKGIWKLILIVDHFFLQTNHQSKIEYRKAEISHNLLKDNVDDIDDGYNKDNHRIIDDNNSDRCNILALIP